MTNMDVMIDGVSNDAAAGLLVGGILGVGGSEYEGNPSDGAYI